MSVTTRFLSSRAATAFTYVDATDGNVTITISAATAVAPDCPVYYRKTDASANTVTITDGGSFTTVLEAQDDTAMVISDGTSYRPLQMSSTDASTVSAALATHAALARTHGKPSSDLASVAEVAQAQTDAETNAAADAVNRYTRGVAVMRSPLPASTLPAAILTTNVAYWLYVGRLDQDMNGAQSIQFVVTAAGAGAQTAEVAWGTSSVAPRPSGNTITVKEAVACAADLTTTGLKSQALSGVVTAVAGDYLFVGIRTAMAVTQPIITAAVCDLGRGMAQTTAAAGVLAAGDYSGTVVAGGTTLSSPNLVLTIG